MRLTDTHCHLDFKRFDKDREAVIKRAFETGVEKILVPAIDVQTSKAAIKLAEKYREVYMLQHSGDVTYGQIAEILDVPVTTVQIRLVRARRMLYDKIINMDEDKVLEK